METTPGPKYPNITVELSEVNGNAFSIIGAVLREMRGKVAVEEIDKFQTEAMSGDYDNLLRTCMKWVDVV